MPSTPTLHPTHAPASCWPTPETHVTGPWEHTSQAHPRRVAKVASAIQREISQMMVYDQVGGMGWCRAGRQQRRSTSAQAMRSSSGGSRWRGHARGPQGCGGATGLGPQPQAPTPTHELATHTLPHAPAPTHPPLLQVLAAAISPERRAGGDVISAIASITHVYVSNDLQVGQ